MMQLLPTEILDWVISKDFNLVNCSNNRPTGCFSEVGTDYLDELHDVHNDYTLAAERSTRSKVVQISITHHRK